MSNLLLSHSALKWAGDMGLDGEKSSSLATDATEFRWEFFSEVSHRA